MLSILLCVLVILSPVSKAWSSSFSQSQSSSQIFETTNASTVTGRLDSGLVVLNEAPTGETTFIDVPMDHLYFQSIEALYQAGYTQGCSTEPMMYCPEEILNRALNYDFMIGINGIATFKNSKLGEVVKSIPKDRLLLETDAPYLAPVPYRGKRNESSYLVEIAGKIAEIYELTKEEIGKLSSRNAENMFKI